MLTLSLYKVTRRFV